MDFNVIASSAKQSPHYPLSLEGALPSAPTTSRERARENPSPSMGEGRVRVDCRVALRHQRAIHESPLRGSSQWQMSYDLKLKVALTSGSLL